MQIRSKIWIEVRGEPVFSQGRQMLLRAIDEYGSINMAAREIGIPYRRAWGYVKAMEERMGISLVNTQVGGERGGGTTLTDEARQFLVKFESLESGMNELVDERFKEIFGPSAGT